MSPSGSAGCAEPEVGGGGPAPSPMPGSPLGPGGLTAMGSGAGDGVFGSPLGGGGLLMIVPDEPQAGSNATVRTKAGNSPRWCVMRATINHNITRVQVLSVLSPTGRTDYHFMLEVAKTAPRHRRPAVRPQCCPVACAGRGWLRPSSRAGASDRAAQRESAVSRRWRAAHHHRSATKVLAGARVS